MKCFMKIIKGHWKVQSLSNSERMTDLIRLRFKILEAFSWWWWWWGGGGGGWWWVVYKNRNHNKIFIKRLCKPWKIRLLDQTHNEYVCK